jgi:hypothetical protein
VAVGKWDNFYQQSDTQTPLSFTLQLHPHAFPTMQLGIRGSSIPVADRNEDESATIKERFGAAAAALGHQNIAVLPTIVDAWRNALDDLTNPDTRPSFSP